MCDSMRGRNPLTEIWGNPESFAKKFSLPIRRMLKDNSFLGFWLMKADSMKRPYRITWAP
jgi:hypothetical protein